MERRAKNELIEVVCGLFMIVVGVVLFLSKARVSSEFLEGSWELWKIIFVMLPLIAGIIMMIVKPDMLASKLIAIAGAVIVIVVLFFTTTIIVEKDIIAVEWVLYSILIFGGLIICAIALLVNNKKK